MATSDHCCYIIVKIRLFTFHKQNSPVGLQFPKLNGPRMIMNLGVSLHHLSEGGRCT